MSKQRARLLMAGIVLTLSGTAISATPAQAAATAPTPPAPRSATSSVMTLEGPQVYATAVPLRHPKGGYFYVNVIRWSNMVRQIMVEQKIPGYYLPGILAQIQQESSGSPNAINCTDSNARRGYASMGLLQTIAPTYRTYAKPGFAGTLVRVNVAKLNPRKTCGLQQYATPYMISPYYNVWAALNYVKGRYGMSKFWLWSKGINSAY